MGIDVLTAVENFAKLKIADILPHYKALNRANNMGDALEYYIEDLFIGATSLDDKSRMKEMNNIFSCQGSQNRPPDLVLKNGDSIEIKKHEGDKKHQIQLNSSYPRAKLYSNDERISKDCKNCESKKWSQKDNLYIIGDVSSKKGKILSLRFVYGDCYAAKKDTYLRIVKKMSESIEGTSDVVLNGTKELARINKVDPLKITSLRVRGMWLIEGPKTVFSYIFKEKTEREGCVLHFLMRKDKYKSFHRVPKGLNIAIEDTQIKDPDNPVKLLDAVYIRVAI